MPTAPVTLTNPGASPDRSDRATFSARAIALDEFTKNVQIPELRMAMTNVFGNAVDAFNAADLATAKAAAAVVSANISANQAGIATEQAALATAQKDAAAISAATALANRGYEVPVAYAAAINLTRASQTVSYQGLVYAPALAGLPFTTSGAFETAKFRIIQGVSLVDLGSALGPTLVGFEQAGAGSGLRTLNNKLQERVSIRDKQGVGDGVANDTTAVASAIDSTAFGGEIETEGAQYLVTSLINPLGKRFVGGGGLLKADRGGLIRLDSYSDNDKIFIGKEYLYRLFLRIRNGGTLRAFIYGDSTVATLANGGGYAGAAFEPQALLPEYLIRGKGIRNNFFIVNRGVGGTRVVQMNAVPDIDTVGGSTDLFIIKYGINDAQDGLVGFATNLRAKLAGIRASSGFGTVDNLSIVLMGPNATYDPGHGRSSAWYEQLRNIYVQAARDYKCAYFDTYALLRDVDWAATAVAGLMMDNPFGDGQSVHPKEIMQTMIWGGLVDEMLGNSELIPYTSDAWQDITLTNGWVNFGGGFAPASASMSRDGWVTLRGLVKNGTTLSGGSIGVMPSYMWPYIVEMYEVTTSAGRCSLRVNTNGNIEQQDGSASATFTSLSSIRFKARG